MTGAPCAGIHPTALIGEPPQHRDYRAKQDSQNYGVAFFRPLIDETALIEAYVTVDSGTTRYTKIGAHVWLMKSVHVGHDAVIGDGCEISPMTSIAGHVTLGKNVRVGQGATFKPFITVGDGARIGMGAVVTRDVPAGEVWAGNPARKLEEKAEPVPAYFAYRRWPVRDRVDEAFADLAETADEQRRASHGPRPTPLGTGVYGATVVTYCTGVEHGGRCCGRRGPCDAEAG